MTKQRMVILEELRSSPSHPTVDEIYVRVRKRLPRISLGTVYRNLERLAESGEIGRLETPGSRMRFDAHGERHCHVRCVECGRVEDIDAEAEDDLASAAGASVSGFRILEKRTEYLGICPECDGKEGRRRKGED